MQIYKINDNLKKCVKIGDNMNNEIISEDMHKFLIISTLILVMGCILIFQLISTINITNFNSQDNNISMIYNVIE